MSSPQTQATLLTKQELEIVSFVTDGLNNPQIAFVLGVSKHVVKNYLKFIYEKLGFHNRVELALWYIKHVEKP